MPGTPFFARRIERICLGSLKRLLSSPDREQASGLQLNQRQQMQSKEICPRLVGKIAQFPPGIKLAIGTE
ncbi:hypothetical protein [Bradyrhizobium sp. S69]|uniref:hypothetical protein n=1 Tax=Bradyrhizobium sp. S69 TaxID=1641856 RepID=UPI001575FBED|nr:hypothetical protein [Bradyrhizobium sp. S69]